MLRAYYFVKRALLVTFLGILIANSSNSAAAIEPVSNIPEFYTSNAWLVSPVKELVSKGIDRSQCLLANQFDNGYIVRFLGGNQQIHSMTVDFRQNVFRNSQNYDVQLRIGRKYAGLVKAKAQGSNSLVFVVGDKNRMYEALRTSSVMDIGIEGTVLRFALTDLSNAMRRMESCANPINLPQRNDDEILPSQLMRDQNPIQLKSVRFDDDVRTQQVDENIVALDSFKADGPPVDIEGTMRVKGVRSKPPQTVNTANYESLPYDVGNNSQYNKHVSETEILGSLAQSTEPLKESQASITKSIDPPNYYNNYTPSELVQDNVVIGSNAADRQFEPYTPTGVNVLNKNRLDQGDIIENADNPDFSDEKPSVSVSRSTRDGSWDERPSEPSGNWEGLKVGDVSKALHYPPSFEDDKSIENKALAPPVSALEEESFLPSVASAEPIDISSAQEPVLEATVDSVIGSNRADLDDFKNQNQPAIVSKAVGLNDLNSLDNFQSDSGGSNNIWEAKAGTDARVVLSEWSERANVDLVWNANFAGPIEEDISVRGSFEDAIRTFLNKNSQMLGIQGELNKGARITNSGSPNLRGSPAPSVEVVSSHKSFLSIWSAVQGDDLQQTLNRWSGQNDVSLFWKSDYNFKVKESFSIEGTYEQALRNILSQYDEETLKPLGNLNIDPSTNLKTLTISSTVTP